MKSQPEVSTTLNREEPRFVIPSSLIVKAVCVYMLCYCPQPYALSWTINRFLQGQEIYSDNIRLAEPGDEKGAFVTEVNPGVSITGQSGRTNLNLNYRMQNIYNAGGDNGLKIYNQLQYNSHNTFIPNRLFLDSNSSIGQQNINSNQIGATNINGSGNSTTVSTFGLSPYWTPRFGSYANGVARINFNTVTTGNASSTSSNPNAISDSINLSETIQLNSGAKFRRVNWGLSLNNSANYRVNSNDRNPNFQNANAIVRTYINTYFNVFAQGGYSNNDFQSTTDSNNSGFYYTFGGQWRPSQRYSIEAGVGNNSFVTVNVSPLQRLNWNTTYSNNAIGTNFGQYSGQNLGQTSGQNSGVNLGQNAGETWQTDLSYRTRRSTWTITHNNSTTTAQQILAQNQIFPDPNQPGVPGNVIDPNPRVINTPNLTNEVIVTKAWKFLVSFNTGKSTLSANAYDQDYEYQNNQSTSGLSDQNTKGLSAIWNWQFASRTSAYIRPLWQRTKYQDSINNNQYYEVEIGVNRSITSRLNGSIDFRHGQQTASGDTKSPQSLGINANDYQENRVTASLFMRF